MNKKEEIIYEALKLFSVNGFDAVSTRMIARAVHASDAVIYKHFKSKREILDTIIATCRKRFLARRQSVDIHEICWENVEKICMDMFYFQTHDEWTVLFRRLLIVEQYKDAGMAQLYRAIFVDSAVDGMTVMFQELMDQGYLKPGDPRVYAMELYAPFFMYHTFHEESEELLGRLEKHVTYFRENYRTARCDE